MSNKRILYNIMLSPRSFEKQDILAVAGVTRYSNALHRVSRTPFIVVSGTIVRIDSTTV